MKQAKRVCAALVAVCLAAPSMAGNATGKIGSVLVGRLGYQVFVQIKNPSFTGFACGTPNPANWHFAFRTDRPGGKDMLAAVLAARASDLVVVMVGTGTCTEDAALEDTSYIITP